jgi:zinc/manganese transport system substrate-binding protein
MPLKFLFIVLISFVSMSAKAQNKPVIITTFSVLEDLTKTIIGDELLKQYNVENLVAAGADPHLFEPSSKELVKVKSADLLLANGRQFEPWLNRLAKSLNDPSKLILVTKNLTNKRFMDSPSFLDPHAWNSPAEIPSYIKTIEESLSEKWPKHKSIFKKNAKRLSEEFLKLDKKYEKLFSSISENKRVLLTTHDGAFYIALRYKIKSISPIGLSTAQEIKTKDLQNLLLNIKKFEIKVIFSEKNHHKILSQKLAKKADIKLGADLYLDGLSDSKGPATTTYKMIDYNLEQIYNSMKE